MNLLAPSCLFLPLLFACTSYRAVSGSGQVVLEQRNPGVFHSISVGGGAQVELTQTQEPFLELSCDDNLLPHIRTEVRDGVLHVGFESGNWKPSQRPVYRIGAAEFRAIDLSGSVALQCDSLQSTDLVVERSGSGSARFGMLETQALVLSTSGSGSIEIGALRSDRLKYRISGSGSLNVGAGKVQLLDAQISGSSEIAMPDLAIREASLRISGSGRATMWVKDHLNVRASGSADIRYRGTPQVQSEISGSGSVRPMEQESL